MKPQGVINIQIEAVKEYILTIIVTFLLLLKRVHFLAFLKHHLDRKHGSERVTHAEEKWPLACTVPMDWMTG